MTSGRLAAIFQPVILSPVKKEEENIEDPAFRRLSQSVLTFLIENWDYTVLGMANTEIEVTDYDGSTGNVKVRHINAEQGVQEAIDLRVHEDPHFQFHQPKRTRSL
jgi:hypothetical protein